MKEGLVRRHIWVQGRVQGVGFRAFAQYTATNLDVTGWVRNVGIDKVEIVAEAAPGAMELFLSQMAKGPSFGRVNAMNAAEETATGEFDMFDIRG